MLEQKLKRLRKEAVVAQAKLSNLAQACYAHNSKGVQAYVAGAKKQLGNLVLNAKGLKGLTEEVSVSIKTEQDLNNKVAQIAFIVTRGLANNSQSSSFEQIKAYAKGKTIDVLLGDIGYQNRAANRVDVPEAVATAFEALVEAAREKWSSKVNSARPLVGRSAVSSVPAHSGDEGGGFNLSSENEPTSSEAPHSRNEGKRKLLKTVAKGVGAVLLVAGSVVAGALLLNPISAFALGFLAISTLNLAVALKKGHKLLGVGSTTVIGMIIGFLIAGPVGLAVGVVVGLCCSGITILSYQLWQNMKKSREMPYEEVSGDEDNTQGWENAPDVEEKDKEEALRAEGEYTQEPSELDLDVNEEGNAADSSASSPGAQYSQSTSMMYRSAAVGPLRSSSSSAAVVVSASSSSRSEDGKRNSPRTVG